MKKKETRVNTKSIKEADKSAPKFNAVERIKISVAAKPDAKGKKCKKHSDECPNTVSKVLPAVAVALILAGNHLLKMLECASCNGDKSAKPKKQKSK